MKLFMKKKLKWAKKPVSVGIALTIVAGLFLSFPVTASATVNVTTVGSGFSEPYAVALDSSGHLIVNDTGNGCIKKMNANGTDITTLYSGLSDSRAMALDSSGNIYCEDCGSNLVEKMDANGKNITTLHTGFADTLGMAVDSSGSIYLALNNADAVIRMSANGKVAQELASGEFDYPAGLTLDSNGRIYVADRYHDAIKRMDFDGGNVATLGSGFYRPTAVAVDGKGNIYVADSGSNSIKRIDTLGNIVTLTTDVVAPKDLAVNSDGTILYVADAGADAIEKITISLIPTTMTATASPLTAVIGNAVTLKASGLPSNATGTVVFSANGKTLCSAQVSGGTASGSTDSSLKTGTYTVTATYYGDLNYAGSSASTSFTLTSVAPKITSGETSATFTAGVTASYTFTATGQPTPHFTWSAWGFANGFSFIDNGDGTATLSGKAPEGQDGTYFIVITASNGETSDCTGFQVTILKAYTVNFNSMGGSTVNAMAGVTPGSGITKPTDPTKPGFYFMGWYTDTNCTAQWDFDTDKVAADTTLYAKWVPACMVSFNSMGGNVVSGVTGLCSGSLVTKPADPTKQNFIFAGWFKEPSCENQWDFTTDKVTVNTTLYAKWIPTYSVDFNSEGGDGVVPKSGIVSGSTLTKPTDPTKSGYVFAGWFKDTSYTNQWIFDTDTVTKNITLYAKWLKIHTVVFKDWDGTTLFTQTVNDGNAATAPSALFRTGYTFTGWDKAFSNVKSNLTVTAQYTQDAAITYTVIFKDWDDTTLSTQKVGSGSAAATPSDLTRPGYTFTGWDTDFSNVTSDLTVTAQYNKNAVITHTVEFMDWDGTTLSSQTVNDGSAATAPTAPLRPGYTLTGWDTDFSDVTGDLTVTALYSQNVTHTVTFKDWDGTAISTQAIDDGGAATAPTAPPRAGYTFTGWDKAFSNVTSDLTVTAAYSQIVVATHTVTFQDWNGTVLSTQTIMDCGAATAPENPSRTGYKFTGWDSFFSNVTGDLTVTAVYLKNTPPTHIVTFSDWNGTSLSMQLVEDGGAATVPADPYRTGYTFTGWDKPFSDVTGDLTVTAVYEENTASTHTVVFKNWDGTALSTQTVNDGSAATAPSAPSRTGYTFTGWDKPFSDVTGDLTVTAVYSRNSSGGYSGDSGGIATSPVNVTITGTETTGNGGEVTTTASIPASATNTTVVLNVTVNLNGITVTVPASVLGGALGSGTGFTLFQSTAPEPTQAAAQTAASKGNRTAIAVININLNRTTSAGTEAVHNLSSAVSVTITLTDAQIAAIKANSNPLIYYYDSDAGTLTDMNATFDLVKGTATFTTTHFSSYLIVTDDKTAPVITGVDNNGIYNSDKAITFNKGTATLDGSAFTSGSTVNRDGRHTLVVTDSAGNTATVVFTIDKSFPVIIVTTGNKTVKNGGGSSGSVTVRISDLFNVIQSVTLGGKAYVWPSNGLFSKDGKYVVTAEDQLGHASTTTFIVDKTAPKIAVKRVKGGIAVMVTEANLLSCAVTLNGKKVAWPKSNTFTKKGAYTVTVTDQAGHKTTSRFKI